MSTPSTTDTVLLDDLRVHLKRSARRTLQLEITREGLCQVRAPQHLPRSQILAFLRAHQTWLVTHQAQWAARQAARAAQPRSATWWHLGEAIPIERSGAPGSALQVAPGVTGFVVASDETPAGELAALTRWQQQEAAEVLPDAMRQQVARLAHQVSWPLAPTRLVCQTMRSRWGSCTRAGRINLNTRLLHVPPELMHYVICHELAHRREMNHSAAFWALLEFFYPGARAADRALKQWARRLSSS